MINSKSLEIKNDIKILTNRQIKVSQRRRLRTASGDPHFSKFIHRYSDNRKAVIFGYPMNYRKLSFSADIIENINKMFQSLVDDVRKDALINKKSKHNLTAKDIKNDNIFYISNYFIKEMINKIISLESPLDSQIRKLKNL
jgi:hypothetical protein